jgi:hypothetical protein
MYETATTYDLVQFNNVDFEYELKVKRGGVDFDFTGYSLKMQVRRNDLLIIAADDFVVSGNLVTILIPAADLLTVEPGKYRYDVVATDGTSTLRLVGGWFTLHDGVSR